MLEQVRPHLKDSNGVGVWEVVQDDGALLAAESDPLDAVQVGIRPVDPPLVHGDAIGPLNVLRHKTIGSRTIHVAPVNARPQVPPVGPEHHPGQNRGRAHIPSELGKWELKNCSEETSIQPVSSALLL